MIQEYISFPKYDKNPVNNLFYYYYYIEAKKKKIYPNTVFVITLCICLRDSAAGNWTILGPVDSQIHGRRHFYNEKYPSGIFKYEALLSHLKVNL